MRETPHSELRINDFFLERGKKKNKKKRKKRKTTPQVSSIEYH